MPQYKDEARGSWFCKFSYQDWTGQRRQKLKRGFPTKREAAAWERSFLEKQQGTPDMTFQALYDLYLEDISHRLKASTIRTKKYTIERYIVPHFKDKPINQITPADIRKWQNGILGTVTKETYQRQINNQLNAILNFAFKYYGLLRNPCRTAGPIGRIKAERMDFWTNSEFNTFIEHVQDITLRTAFETLYYTGLRCGEMLALNIGDVDLEKGIVSVTKTYHRVKAQNEITPPKTAGSVRTVTIPPFLVDNLKDYMHRLYGAGPENRLFFITRSRLVTAMNNACKAAGVKRIRTHDIRHSHVSLLIEMGFSPLLIAERIGDSVDMVNNIYGHLYPNKHSEVADKLQQFVSK